MGSYETVYLAEKHSIAQALADVLPGRKVKHEGYIACGTAAVTWLSGHLLEQAPPEAYGDQYRRWSRETLPIVPREFISTVRQDRNIPRQMAVIKDLLANAPSAVNAADFDREGQLLVDEVLELLHYAGSVQRLQTKALDRTSLLRELGRMRPNSEFAGLRDAARARSELDWLAGMNLTRAMTVHWRASAAGVLSLGRVQTPTLALIVERDLAIENFVSKPYWTLECPFTAEAGPFTAQFVPHPDMEGIDEERRLVDKACADRIAREASSQPGAVAAVERKEVSEAAPLPYSLTDIQKEASAKYGMGASTVLAACQSLYEAKYASYPRTDCCYLPLEQFAEAPQVLAAAGAWPGMEDMAKLADPARRSACWNTSKVKAHHAIIPTAVPAKHLSERDAKIYALICRRYIWQFLPPHRFEKTRIDVDCAGWRWRAQGRVDIEAGWSAFKDRDPKDRETVLPPVAKGDPVQAGEVKVAEHKTEPPKRFTEGTLVYAMENIQRFLKDASRDEKSILTKTEGLGTVATRAGIIQTLFSRQYIERQGKAIVSTPIGRELVRLCPKSIKDPLMTADMERSLSEIQDGRIPFKEYVAGYAARLPALLDEIFAVSPAEGRGFAAPASPPAQAPAGRTAPNAPDEGAGPRCPRCGSELRLRQGKNGPFWGCSGFPRCRFTCPDASGVPELGSAPAASRQSQAAAAAPGPPPGSGQGALSASAGMPGQARPFQAPQDAGGTLCPRCQEGRLAPREGKDGPVWRCDRYPRCRYACPDRNGFPDVAAAPTKPSRRKKAAAEAGRKPLPAASGPAGGASAGSGGAGAPGSGDGRLCPRCREGTLQLRQGRNGPFWGCSNYPQCRFTCEDQHGEPCLDGQGTPAAGAPACPRCKEGRLQRRQGKNGPFWGCDRYPGCRFTCEDREGTPDLEGRGRRSPAGAAGTAVTASQGRTGGTGGQPAEAAACPRCHEGTLQLRQGRNGPFWGCSSYPSCRFTCEDKDGAPDLEGRGRHPTSKGWTAAPWTGAGAAAQSGALPPDGQQQAARQREAAEQAMPCPRCGSGRLTLRQGKNGAFWGCSNYPACRFTADDAGGAPLLGPSPSRRDLAWQPGGKAAAEAPRAAKTARSASAGKGLREGSLFDLAGAPAVPDARSFSRLPSAGLFEPARQTRQTPGPADDRPSPAFRAAAPAPGGAAVPWTDDSLPGLEPRDAGLPPELPDMPDIPDMPDAPWADFTPDESAMPDFGDIPLPDDPFPDGLIPGDPAPGDGYPDSLPRQASGGGPSAPASQGRPHGQHLSGMPCPSCKTNRLVLRQGRNGPFWGCSGFPRCRFTCQDRDGQPQLPPGGSAQGAGRRS